jgi:putative transposase
VILMAVRWYLRHPLSATSVMELLAERGIDVSNRTVLRWVQAFGPQLAAEARKHRRPLGRCWYTDEMFFFRGNDKWYLYRAIDERGQVVDVLLRSTATPPPLKRSSSRRCAVLARYRVRSSPTTISRTSRRSSGPYQPPCTFEVDSIA